MKYYILNLNISFESNGLTHPSLICSFYTTVGSTHKKYFSFIGSLIQLRGSRLADGLLRVCDICPFDARILSATAQEGRLVGLRMTLIILESNFFRAYYTYLNHIFQNKPIQNCQINKLKKKMFSCIAQMTSNRSTWTIQK